MSNVSRKTVFLNYILLPLTVLALSSLFDALFVLPLVEIDHALRILYPEDHRYQQIRSIGTIVVPLILFLIYFPLYVGPVVRSTRNNGFLSHSSILERVLQMPLASGLAAAATGMLVFLFISILDLMFLSFPLKGERGLYFLTTFTAMLSTSIFSFTAVFLTTDFVNRRKMIPAFFPQGRISAEDFVTPMTFTTRLIFLWLAVGVYPVVVLGTGYFPRNGGAGLEKNALLFILTIIPIGFYLAVSAARSFRHPVSMMLRAVEQIGREEYPSDLRSDRNDELGYLTDHLLDMADSLEEKRRMKDTFGRVVDPRVRDLLLSGGIQLGGERKTAVVLFCDIRGFTGFSEGKDESLVVRSLNDHLTAMEECVTAGGGMINKFMGDGFLALFGFPLEEDLAPQNAVEAAVAMLKRNTELNRERLKHGQEKWSLGIGIHYGPVLAGKIGSPNRMEYSVIGDTVNTASRIQELSKKFRHSLYFTDSLQRELSSSPKGVRFLGNVRLRGKERSEGIWTIA